MRVAWRDRRGGCAIARCWTWLACVALSSWSASSRLLRDTIKIGISDGKLKYDHNKWHYIAKFAFQPEGGNAAIRIRLDKGFEKYPLDKLTLQIDFSAYNEVAWHSAKKVMQEHEGDQVNQAYQMCKLSSEPYYISPSVARVLEFPLIRSGDDNWGKWVDVKFAPGTRTHMWYFTLSDCEGKLQKSFLEFELKLTQADGSELSVERQYSLPSHFISLVVLFLFMIYWACRLRRQEGSWEGVWQLHPLVYCLTAIMICQFLGHLCHSAHLAGFAFDGIGNEFVDIAAEVLMVMAQVMQTLLLIMMASGYALVDEAPESDLHITCVFVIMGIHVLVAIVSHFSGTEHAHRFHGHEGLYGYFLVTMRLVMFAWFLCVSERTRKRAALHVKAFIRKLQAAGCIYFLTYPFMYGVIEFVAPYYQHRVMQIAVMGMHFLMNAILAHLFLAGGDHFRLKSGWYHTASFWGDDEEEAPPPAPEPRTPPTAEELEMARKQQQDAMELTNTMMDDLDLQIEGLAGPQSSSASSSMEPTSFGRDSGSFVPPRPVI